VKIRKIYRWLLWLVAGLFALSLLLVILYRFVPVPYTPLMAIRAVQQKKSEGKAVLHHQWVPLEDISANMMMAVVASEDQRFFEHIGLDMEQIKKARKENLTRRRPRGASTISQQTAKKCLPLATELLVPERTGSVFHLPH